MCILDVITGTNQIPTGMWVVQGLVGLVITLAGYVVNLKAESIKREQQLVTKNLNERIKNNEDVIRVLVTDIKDIRRNGVTKDDIKELKAYLRELINVR